MLLGGEAKDGDTIVVDARVTDLDALVNPSGFGEFDGGASGLVLRVREG